jgi:hypothetical protein
MTLPARMKFGIFMAPFHPLGEDPTLSIERDLELMQWLDYLGFDEAWIGEHHSSGWEIIASPELFIAMVERGAWCVGTPDDLIAHIQRLDEESGGYGGFLVQATEWGTREQVLHSYELIARYVKPYFQGSLANLQHSATWAAGKKNELTTLRTQAIDKAKQEYFAPQSVGSRQS